MRALGHASDQLIDQAVKVMMEPGKVSMKSVKAGAKESIRELGNATAVAVVQAGKYQLQKAVGVDVDDVVEGDRAVIDETVEAVREASVFAKEGGMQVEDTKERWRGTRILGPYHRETLNTVSNIAQIKNLKGEPDEALVLY